MHYVNKTFFKVFILIEQTFLNLIKVVNISFYHRVNVLKIIKDSVINDPVVTNINAPTCHNITVKLIDRFIRYRFKIHTATIKNKINCISKSCKTSRSIAMRQLVGR